MRDLSVIVLVATGIAICSGNLCFLQELDWQIELLLPHRECDKFYQCTHGQPVEMSCPKGLYFSIIEQICNWKEDVDCGNRIISEDSEPDDEKSEEEVDTAPEPGNDSDEDEGPSFPVIEFLPNGCPVNSGIRWLLPHERSCKRYYKCLRGKKVLRRCKSRLHFNRRLQACDWPINAGCKN